MWYSESKYNQIKIAKPLRLPSKKRSKHKHTRNFDAPGDIHLPNLDNTPPLDVAPHIPVTPNIPEPVMQNPVSDFIPEPEVPKKLKKKPEELESLYGPDTDIKDDHIIHKPDNQQEIQNIVDKNNLPQEIEQPKSVLDEPIVLPDPETGNIEEVPEAIPEEIEEEEPEPESIEEPIDSPQPVPDPPVHEFCHCEVVTLPGGRRIWRANSGACSQCLQARDIFNQWQASLYGS